MSDDHPPTETPSASDRPPKQGTAPAVDEAPQPDNAWRVTDGSHDWDVEIASETSDDVRRALQKYSREFLLLISPRGEMVASSVDDTIGYGEEQHGHHIAENLHPDDIPRVFDLIERARASAGFEETIRVRARGAQGEWHYFDCTVIDAMGDPQLRGAVIRVREIEPREATVVAPAGSGADRFLSLAEALPMGILTGDARGYVVFCNASAQQLFNLSAETLLGQGFEKAVHPSDRPDVINAAGAALRTGLQQQVTFRVETGLFPRWAHAKFVPLGSDDRRTGWIATIEDITDRRRAETQLAHQATHDPLTQLPNRMLLEDRLAQACSRLRRDGDSVTVVFVDLDRFKEVNDSLGHRAGDGVLTEVARRLRRVTRDVDTVARLGGDEFVIVCEALPPGEVEQITDRIAESLRVPMLVEGHQVAVGASVGVAVSTDPAVDAGDLLFRADQEMYRAKVASPDSLRQDGSSGG